MHSKYGGDMPMSRRGRFCGVGLLALTVAAGAWMAASVPARADGAQIHRLEREMHHIEAMHQKEIRALQAQINRLRHARAHYAGPVVKGPEVEPPFVIMSKGHQFGLSSPDGLNTIEFTGRVHMDTGGYLNYNPLGTTAAAHPALASPVVNFRRARIGFVGKFMGDWNWGIIADFGGSTDAGGASAIENAFVTYKGFYNHHQRFPVAITIGAIDVPWTLGEAVSSNDLVMMERPTPQVMATSFGGGDNRTSLGFTSNNHNYFAGAWLTGPTTGALHTAGATGLGPTFAALARVSYTIMPTPDSTLHAGFNYANMFAPRTGTNLEGYSFSDKPEVRLDPTSLFSIGTIPISDGQVFGAEAAGTFMGAYIQGEYFHYMLDSRTGTTAGTLAGGTAGPSINGDGGYVEASYSFGGKRHYKAGCGCYSGVIPDHPLAFGSNGWGAVELAGTFSIVNFDSSALTTLATAGTGYTSYTGARQVAYGGGINWYPNLNMKFMLDYEHVVVSKPLFQGGGNVNGATVDWIGARTQFMW